jgi:hypothetical protein
MNAEGIENDLGTIFFQVDKVYQDELLYSILTDELTDQMTTVKFNVWSNGIRIVLNHREKLHYSSKYTWS